MATSAEIQAKIDKLEVNMGRLDQFTNGDDTTDVTVDSGTVPSISKFIKTVSDDFSDALVDLTVKVQTLSTNTTDYVLNTDVPSLSGHLYLNVYVGGAHQPKDGLAYTVVNNGTVLRLSEIPPIGTAIYAESATTAGTTSIELSEYNFDTKALASAATINGSIHSIEVRGGTTINDGNGGLYVNQDTGSSDTFTSNGGTRTWWSAKDVSSKNRVKHDRLVDAPVIVQKKLMEPFFGFDNLVGTDTSIFTGAGYTAQGFCILTVLGVKKLFVATRTVADNYLVSERHRIVQFSLREDGGIGTHEAYSEELNIGHSGGLSGTVDGSGNVTFYSWMPTVSGHEGNDSGKGFSKIDWKGNLTTQSDVTSYQVFDWNAGSGNRSDYYHADCGVSEDGSEIAFFAYRTAIGGTVNVVGADNFIGGTVFVFDLSALMAAPNDAARIAMAPKRQWVHKFPHFDRGMYKQGIAIRKGMVATICGFTNPFTPEAISIFDSHGNLLKVVQPTSQRSEYGYDVMLDHPTLGTPMQSEPEGLCWLDDGEIAYMIMEQWRKGASIVDFANTTGLGGSKQYSCISLATTAAPTQVDAWVETKKASNAGNWNVSNAASYTYGTEVSRRSKLIYSIRVPRGDAGELDISAGMPQDWSKNIPITSYENTPNITFKADSAFNISGYSSVLDEFMPAIRYNYTRTSASTLRISDFWYQAGPEMQMTYAWNAGTGRQFGGIGFATGTGNIIFYGAGDSNFPGEILIRNVAGGGMKVRSGTTGAVIPYNATASLGESATRWGTVWAANVSLAPGIGTTVTPANNGDLMFEIVSNTSVRLRLRGSDGTVRSATLTLS